MNSAAGTEAGQCSCQPIPKNKKKFLLSMATDHTRKSSSSSSSPFSPSYYCSRMNQMNHDHLISILQLLPVESILSFSMTCKKFRSLASSDLLWESICRREWGSAQLNSLVATFPLPEKRRISWKRLYQQVSQMGSFSCCRLPSKDGIFPEPRASHSLNWVEDYLVLFGGGCQGGKHLDDTWVAYVGNGVKRTIDWQLVQSDSCPSGRFGHTCTVVGNFLVIFGGINDNGARQNDTWIWQVVQDGLFEVRLSWKLLDVGTVAPCPRGAHAGCSVGDKKMVIHGGIGLNGVRLDDVWVLDISSGCKFASWQLITAIGPSPPARSGHSLTWIGGNRMVLFGGRGMGYNVLNDVWLFDLGEECSEWVKVVYDCSISLGWLPLPRVGHSAIFILGGRVLIYGGEDSYRHRKDDFWLLDVSTLPTAKMNVVTVDSKTVLGKMWRRLKAEGQKPECRSFHTACADLSGRYLYIFGGMVDGVLNSAEGMSFDGGLYLVELM